MADDILSRAIDQKTGAIKDAEALQLMNRAKEEAPGLYSAFLVRITQKGLEKNGWENPSYRQEVHWLAGEFSRFLQNKNEESSTQTLSQEINSFLPPQEILEAGIKIASDRKTFIELSRIRFPKALVDNFITQSRIKNQEYQEELEREAAAALAETQTGDGFIEKFVSRVRQVRGPELAVETQRYLSQEIVTEKVNALFSEEVHQEYFRTVEEGRVSNTAVHAVLLRERRTNHPFESIDDAKTEAIKQTKILEVFGASQVPNAESLTTPEGKTALENFFRSFPKGGQRALAPLGSSLSLWAKQTQQDVAQIVTGETFHNTLNDSRLVEKHFGGQAPPYFPALKQQVSQSLAALKSSPSARSPQARTVLAAARRFGFMNAQPIFLETISALETTMPEGGTVFSFLNANRSASPGPTPNMVPGTLHTPTAGMENYLSRFFVAGKGSMDGVWAFIHANGSSATHILFNLNGVAGQFLRLGAGRATKAAAGKTGQWFLKTGIGKLIGGVIGSLGGVPGIIAGLLLGEVAGRLFGKIKGFFGGIAGAFRMGAGGGAKRPFYESTGFAIMLVCAPLVLVFFMTFLTTSVLTGAFFITNERPVGGSAQGSSASLRYNGQTPPVSTIATAPAIGDLSQTPFEAGTTHAKVDAVDVPGPMGTLVVAAQDGFIVSNGTNNGCLWDDKLGKYVRIVGSCGGEQCVTTYAHLLSCSSAVATAIPGDTTGGSPATIIKAGTQIGQFGSTGNSTGPHLHFQYNGPGKLADFFPSIAQEKI